jgi:hypothetical protein
LVKEMLSQLQVEGLVEQDELDSMRHRLWRLEARMKGFGEREAVYLAFWRWLASEREESSNRESLAAGVAVKS